MLRYTAEGSQLALRVSAGLSRYSPHPARFPNRHTPDTSLNPQHTFIQMTAPAQSTPITVTTHNQYEAKTSLTPADVRTSPLDQFRDWFLEAQNNPNVLEPEALSLSTATPSGVPSSRMVLLKQVDDRGFKIYTNYTSRKSQELKTNPHAALNFYWRELHRQVRVVGRAEMVTHEDSEEYFRSRPTGSQIGAWASRQSSIVDENEVTKRFSLLEQRFGVEDGRGSVPMPEFWGGWRIVPEYVCISQTQALLLTATA